MSESRLILVDGSGYIFRAYYALPPMNNSKGIPTNAVYGFCNIMLRLIDEHPHDKILIILDAGKNTFRNTLYPEYKALYSGYNVLRKVFLPASRIIKILS